MLTQISETSADFADDHARLARTSTAERVAEVLRDRVTAGYFRPGARLSEDVIGNALGVSRNTLREAFRLLSHERLLMHHLNRGVFVRVLSADDVHDVYAVRRIIEIGAVRDGIPADPQLLEAVGVTVVDGEQAAERAAWQDVGTADLRFHQAVAGLARSPRINELMRGLLAELRLVFHVMADPEGFHRPYLTRNREIHELLASGDGAGAEQALTSYLLDAEEQITVAYASIPPQQATGQ